MKKQLIYLIIAIFLVNFVLAQVEVKYIGVCNGDGICNSKENYQNCPQDCISSQRDRYCDGVVDNVCDPDCGPQADPDCEPKVSLWQKLIFGIKKPFIGIQSLRPAMQKAYYIIITGSIIIILSIIVLLIILTKKISKYRKEKLIEEIKKEPEISPLSPKMQTYYNMLKKPVKRLFDAGYTRKEIKAKLIEKGWPKKVLNILFKKL